MRDVFLEHIYVMYALWFAAGVMLLAYIAYRRKRKTSVKPSVPGPTTGAAH